MYNTLLREMASSVNSAFLLAGPPVAKVCKTDYFQCNNGKCILDKWKCNGLDECGDKSDENMTACQPGTSYYLNVQDYK